MAIDYKKLTVDLIEAHKCALKAAEGEDGGTANLDTMVLRLPRANEEKVVQAIKEAGLFCSGRRDWLGPCYFIGAGCGGQGNSRTRAVEALKESMQNSGWNVSVYYKMD